jgi:hypothetical protein
LEKRQGNALFTDLMWLFCQIGDSSEQSLYDVLDELEARKLIVKDGSTHRGVHNALTWEGHEKTRDTQEYPKAA